MAARAMAVNCIFVVVCLGFVSKKKKKKKGQLGLCMKNSLGSSLWFVQVHASSFPANHWFYCYDAIMRLYIMTSGHRLAQWNAIYKEALLLNCLKPVLPLYQSHTLISNIRSQDIHLCSFLFWAQLFLTPVKVPSTLTRLHLRAVRGTLFVFRSQNLGPAPLEPGRQKCSLILSFSTVLYFSNSCENLKLPFY
jgi:hypothetical protein